MPVRHDSAFWVGRNGLTQRTNPYPASITHNDFKILLGVSQRD